MSGTSHSAGPSGASKRILGEGTSSDIGPVKRQKRSKYHAAAGLKLTIHGNVYQLKLLTLFLKRGLKLKYSFILATELVEAEKFDDIVFGYTDENGKDVCRFLQAKHKQDETKTITLRDLLTEKDDEFSIKKYFISYRKIKQNLEFKGYYLQDFTICTNINLDENLAKNFEDITGTEDDILHFEYHDGFRRYKINLDRFPKKGDLESILCRTSEHLRLANMLAVHVLEDKPLKLSDLFKAYHGVLGEKVIERVEIDGVKVGKFRSEFINGECEQSPVLKRFRKCFHEEYRRVSKTMIDENDFWVKMKETNLKISSTFGKKFELDPNPQLTTDKEALAEKIAKAVKEANKKIVQILRERGKKGGIIRDNIDKLAGYVFVKKEDKNTEFYFSLKFLDKSEKLPHHLEAFRTKFVEKLEDEGMEFSKMNEYKFRIANFVTCEEGQLGMKPSLPDDYIDDTDIQGFFESFVLSVNQPNEEELGDIIQDEIGEDFKLIDSDLMASKLQEDMLNWMKEKKGRFLTNDEGNKLFKEIHQKVSKLVLIGPTLVYLAKIEQFQISFCDDLNALQGFLNSEHGQIFNLISSCDDTIFSSIKVLQTLKNLKCYQTEDSYIYMRLDSILYIRERVMEAFGSRKSKLLAIECKAKKNEINLSKFYKQLSALLKMENDKKVILITLKNDIFANKFKRDFSVNNNYKEINDKSIDLTDLIVKSQEKILTEGKVVFLGKEVSLNAVLDAESSRLLSGEVLSMLIKNERLELGKPPIDPKHIEVEDYFIDRTLTRYIMIKSDFMKNDNFLVLDDQNLNGTVELCDDVKSKIESCSRSCTDIILISDSRDEFIKLRDKYRKRHSIHWLKKEKGKNRYIYRWQQSCGDLTELQTFIDTSEQSLEEYKLNKITDLSDKVVLVAAEPGMGKSALLSHLSLETLQSIPSPLWIVRSNLIDHSNEFSEWLETNAGTVEISVLEAVKFLYKMIFDKDAYFSKDGAVNEKIDVISSCLTQNEEDFEITAGSNVIKDMTGSSLLQIKLFTHFFNKGKVVLLFDGFDEISPHYNDLVVKFLKVLKDTKVKSLWLTTRPYNILRKPENQFSTFAYTLQPFLKEDQKNFLMKYWKKNMKIAECDEASVNKFIKWLLYHFSESTNDPGRKFTSIPLQILMLADMLSAELKKSAEPFWKINKNRDAIDNTDAIVNKLDLVTLYENFLENKLDIELEKIISNKRDKKKCGMLSITEKERLDFRKSHEILAVCSIFRVDQCKKVLSTGEHELIKELKALISETKNKTGVIINIVDDKPEFIHLTFAEYFAAQFIWKKFISNVKLEEFKEKIVRNTVIEMLIRDGAIQVSKFLALIAKKYFYGSVDLSTWESRIKILSMELTNRIEDNSVEEKDNVQSTKLLLGIIDFFLQKKETENHSKIIENLSKVIRNQSPELLCVCVEMGYTKLARTLTSVNTELLKQHHHQMKWSDCPLWLAAKNDHLDIMIFLVERLSYDAEWQDKDGQFLIQHIFIKKAFNVLKSCLELNLIDCRPFKDQKDVEKLPLYEALAKGAPVEVIKLLIEKTDAGIVNVFIQGEYKLPKEGIILSKLLQTYENSVEIIELALKKGIDFSFCLNDILCTFKLINVCCPHRLQYWYPTRPINSIDRRSFCEGHNILQNLFPIIEHLLRAGAGYSFIDARRDPSDSTYCIVKQAYDIHKLSNEIYNFHKQNGKENDNPRQMLFRLFFNYIRSLGFEAVEITIKPEELLILIHYQEECEHKSHILDLIFGVIESQYMCYYKSDLDNISMCISVPRNELWFHVFLEGRDWGNSLAHLGFKKFMEKLFFDYYIDDNSNLDLVKSTVDELKNRVLEENSAHPIPVTNYSYRKYKTEVYRKCRMLRYDNNEKLCRESRNKWVKSLLCDVLFCDVLFLYFEQCYKINDALDEISEKVIKLEEAFNKLLKIKNKSSSEHSIILDEDQILDVLGLKNIACEREDIQKLASEIFDTTTGLNDFCKVLYMLDNVSQRYVMPVLEQWLKLSDTSKLIFDLFKELHEGYENLICAVREDDIDKVTSALQNINQDFVKAVIHGQDEHYGSPLHYAALNGQTDIINIFLDSGANPNLRLCNNFEKITHFSQAVEKMGKYPSSDNFVNWSPLYFAVLNDHLGAVQNLIERGADVNHVLNPGQSGYSPLHISALSCGSLKISQLLLKNGARYNVPNKEGKTPLNLATSGSDVEKLLRSIDKLFQIVEQGERNTVNAVFDALDFDSWEAVLNAENIDAKTLLELTNNDARKDVFKFLSEKLRFGEPRVRQR
ncbi:uncharacterized protein LOC135836944 [Planococcus citri]|uniref:uncharacterized protein LOC135836944 n=1 Tax=Planococcus citri TaxID=170843 RepID=UPI0031F95313